MVPAVVHSAWEWERQTAGDAAADAARQDLTTCSHDLLQPSNGLTPTDRPVSDGWLDMISISWRHGACGYSQETAGGQWSCLVRPPSFPRSSHAVAIGKQRTYGRVNPQNSTNG